MSALSAERASRGRGVRVRSPPSGDGRLPTQSGHGTEPLLSSGMVRTVLFVVGCFLAVASAIYSAQQPIEAARFMLTLQKADGRVLLLMCPFALAVAASVASIFVGWKMFSRRRTSTMFAVLFIGSILPLLAAPLAHAAICSVACEPLKPVERVEAACASASSRVTALRHLPVSHVVQCEGLESSDEPSGYQLVGLHGPCAEEVCGSTLMGWFAVRKENGDVFEYDVAESKLGRAVTVGS